MGKRFGRNQKREARKALLEANVKLAQKSHTLETVMRDKLELEKIINDIDEMLSFGSALLPPKSTPVHSQNSMIDASIYVPIMGESITRAVRLRAIIASIEHFKNGTRDLGLHVYVKFGDDRMAYALSDEALRLMPKHRLINILQQDIARQLATSIAQKFGGNG